MEDLAMTEDAAAWAVRSWATALEDHVPTVASEVAPPIAPTEFLADRRHRTISFSPKRNLTEQTTLPTHENHPAAVPTSGDREDQGDFVKALEGVVARDEAVKKAAKADITGTVVGCGMLLSLVSGPVSYCIAVDLYGSYAKHSGAMGALGAAAGIATAFFLIYWLCSRHRDKETSAAEDALATSIKRAADYYPKSVCAFGGPALLRDIEALRHIICSLKAGNGVVVATATPPQPTAPLRAASRPPLVMTPGVQPHRGGVVLTLGILGVFLPLLAVLAWVMGHSDIGAIEARKMDQTGEGQTRAGRILGMIVCIFWGTLIFAKVASSK